MTDNEIIKALECCPKRWDVEELERVVCQKCPYYNVSCCELHLMTDALSLINRQQAENDGLQQLVNLSIDTQNEMNATIIEQKAEIERLQAEIDKQYEIAEANVRAEIASGGTSCHWCEDTARAEAIKEFAERLKKIYDNYTIFGRGVAKGEIDCLVKEMVGEDK